ncbi:unnamed protein product, partial [Darwinula stevensoni]
PTPARPDSPANFLSISSADLPEVGFQLGSKLTSRSNREGEDVYLECSVRANPPSFSVFFTHKGNRIRQNASAGVILTNQTLVLQDIRRWMSGDYRCHAQNLRGEGVSLPVTLDVRFAPRCSEDQEFVYGVSLGEGATVSCKVDSNPPANRFRWAFNASSEVLDLGERDPSHLHGASTSVFPYTPKTEFDFGTLLCWAVNDIGQQRFPCVFHLIQTGPPEPLINCVLQNLSMTSLSVSCQEGFNGGLPQFFVMEVYDHGTRDAIRNITSFTPSFTARELRNGAQLSIVIYAANGKGRSVSTILEARTAEPEEVKQVLGMPKDEQQRSPVQVLKSPLLLSVLGFFGLALLVSVAMVLYFQCLRKAAPRGRGKDGPGKDNEGGPDLLHISPSHRIGTDGRLTPSHRGHSLIDLSSLPVFTIRPDETFTTTLSFGGEEGEDARMGSVLLDPWRQMQARNAEYRSVSPLATLPRPRPSDSSKLRKHFESTV